jgi:pimeloyl-ACP methyl ester carboxylesterase
LRTSLACIVVLGLVAGCYSERSVILPARDAIHQSDRDGPPPRSTRDWLEFAHARLGEVLPKHLSPPLLTDDLTGPAGDPADVYRHFGRSPGSLQNVLLNPVGIMYTAQASGERFLAGVPEPWPGFEDVWIPVEPGLDLSGRLGLVRDAAGDPRSTDCIVLLPGLFGDNSALRLQDVATVLLSLGYHVLALEQRGHGQTEKRYPDKHYSFGVLETGDVLAVAEWLQARPEVRETGRLLLGRDAGAAGGLGRWTRGSSPRDRHGAAALPSARQRPPALSGRHFGDLATRGVRSRHRQAGASLVEMDGPGLQLPG